MEEEEKGITLGDIFKVIFKRVWWVVGVTAAVLIAFVCVIQFWYNPSNQVYSAQFELRLPYGNTYPDGTALRLSDSVMLENLRIIKAESYLPEEERTGIFKDVDIEKMVEDESYVYHNSINVAKKYFKDEDTAVAFTKAVVEFPVTKARYLVQNINYYERLTRYDTYTTYGEKIATLNSQKDYISSVYAGIANVFGGEYVPAGLGSTKTIAEYQRDLINVFDQTEQDYINKTIAEEKYFFNAQEIKRNNELDISLAEEEIEDYNELLQGQKEAMQEVIDKLGTEEVSKHVEAFNAKIADYTEHIISLQRNIERWRKQIERIDAYTASSGEAADKKAAFDKTLGEIRAEIEECTAEMAKVNIATYNEKAQVIYVNNKIEAEGGLNILLAAVIGLLIGFVLVSVVILIIDLPAYKRVKYAPPANGEISGQTPEVDVAAAEASEVQNAKGEGEDK